MPVDYAWPPVIALLVWWLGTGLVMLLDGLPRATFRLSLALSTLMAIGALACIRHTAQDATATGAYAGFVCAVLVWGWHELAFLTGWITGPRQQACSAPGHGPTRFREAVQAILWHELAIIAMTLLILAMTWGQANPVAGWTFALLWVMRLSAKLNLFLGVRNHGEEFLPPHLVYLGSYFRHRRMNALLPVSLLAGAAVTALLIDAALGTSSAGLRTGWLLLASLLSLALLEHLMMVLPLSPALLWRWAMRTSPGAP